MDSPRCLISFKIGMYTYLLYQYLGPSVLYGLAVLFTVIPLNSITLRILDRMSRLENEARDARTKRTTESINNMKLLKVQGWEEQFASDIRRHRADELYHHRMRGIVRAINSAITNAVPALVLVVTLTAYAKTGRPIVASTVFTAISLFNQLRFPLFFYPMLIDALANGKNSLLRLSSYLTSEELTPYVTVAPSSSGGSIELKNGNFLWSTSEATVDGEVPAAKAPALCNAELKVDPGEVVAVVGAVGSGKTAIIKALLGELAPVPRMVVDRTYAEAGAESGIDRPSVTVSGNIAYCSQEAWLPKGTIRDAIVFGRDFDEERYKAAIYDAGLDKDMDPVGGVLSDLTDVGEGGSSLSGGQRARVALARALYSDKDTTVFLLDDCLAALDATVGSLVFERITKRFKGQNAAAVLVSNDPSLPRRCDRVILMGSSAEGRASQSASTCSTIVDTGTYDALLRRGHKLQSFSMVDNDITEESPPPSVTITSSGSSDPTTSAKAEVIVTPTSTPHMIRVTGGYRVNATSISPGHADPDCAEIDCRNCPDSMADRAFVGLSESTDDEVNLQLANSQLVSSNHEKQTETAQKQVKTLSTDESMSTEAVPFSIYTGYLKAVRSPLLVGAMVIAFVTANGAQFFQQYTVAKWTELARGDATASALGGTYLQSLVYAAGVVSIFLWLRSYLTMLVGARASAFYHDRMVTSVFQAPMSFFDTTPSGQIMSRFGKEIGTVDRALPDSLASVLFCALQIGSSALALAGAITPVMLIPMLFAGSLYVRTMTRFRPAARDLKRSETKTRSPIFTHFGEALRGTEIIRSIPGAKMTWSRQHRRLSDKNISVFSTVKALDRWLSISLEFLGNSMVFATAIASVVLARAGKLHPGAAGWGLTQSLAITGLMAWAVRNLTMLESHMMSVMRVRELTDLDMDEADTTKAPPNAASVIPKELKGVGEALEKSFPSGKRLGVRVAPTSDASLQLNGWPWKGNVLFKNVSMRYSPSSPYVLKDVTIQVRPGSTLGIVGRTGSGKSSLLLTLFRIVEIEKGGSIEIDGVDIRSVAIQTLRESLSIIPQDPVMFEGTLAYNLDATGKTSEKDMWEALQAASPELARQFRDASGLDSHISEGGGNLSQGQRQLICLARALLRKSKILVMDEATSSVDATTDQQVQATIRREFVEKGVSVITVAHRLDTVLGYDNIAVLGDGELLEYGKPFELLKIRDGELKKLVLADRQNKMKGGKAEVATSV
jgi:ABC-type multidrug transport system fused ATPase/permease subunit